MIIPRQKYLDELVSSMHNGMIKVITGLRRSGKSFLLFEIFVRFLKAKGVDDAHIIKVNLEDRRNKELRDPDKLLSFIDSRLKDENKYYILLDEVQNVAEFEDVLNSYLHIGNADVYVTGSNSKFLSTDIITEFRGRGWQIHVYPLTFSEFMSVQERSLHEAWHDYMTYGGLPRVLSLDTPPQKANYLKELFATTYLKDIKERYNIRSDEDMAELLQTVASCIGSPTNPTKLANTFNSLKHSGISGPTVSAYLRYLEESFLTEKAERYDIKGKKYIGALAKYYFTDVGLRNAVLNFRQSEETHLMENVIFNELRARGFTVDVGMVSLREREDNVMRRRQLEIDFVVNHMSKRYYIQSALSIPDREKMRQESASLINIPDGFRKVIICKDYGKPWHNEEGILILGLFEFLLNPQSLDY